jgi:hypothetical protein
LVKSPEAPKITITQGGAGRAVAAAPLEAISSAICIVDLSKLL